MKSARLACWCRLDGALWSWPVHLRFSSLLETAGSPAMFSSRSICLFSWFPVILINPSVLTSLSLLRDKDVVVPHCLTTSPATCWDFKVQHHVDPRESGCHPPRRHVFQSGARACVWCFEFSLVTSLHCCPRTLPLHNPSAPGLEGTGNYNSQHPFHLPAIAQLFPFPT